MFNYGILPGTKKVKAKEAVFAFNLKLLSIKLTFKMDWLKYLIVIFL